MTWGLLDLTFLLQSNDQHHGAQVSISHHERTLRSHPISHKVWRGQLRIRPSHIIIH
jgi:hypothetical protein